jgi:deoxyribonuclease V
VIIDSHQHFWDLPRFDDSGSGFSRLQPRHWPLSVEELVEEQTALGREAPPSWKPERGFVVGGCFVCFDRGPSGPGRAGDRAWAAAAVADDIAVITGSAGAPYQAGLLALREGPLLEAAVQALPRLPDVLLVDATGRDHPRRSGLALQLGAVLDLPTVGVTHRTLLATGEWPGDVRGAVSPLRLAGEVAGHWLRTADGKRPLAVHAAWRTDPGTALEVVRSCTHGVRTPEPIRRARTAARSARAGAP